MPLIEDLGSIKVTGSARYYSYTATSLPSTPSISNSSGTSRGKRSTALDRNRFTDSATRQRAIKRRIAELERENYNEQHLRFDIPRIDIQSQTGGYTSENNKRRQARSHTNRSGATPATRRILASRKTLSNLLDDDHISAQSLSNLVTKPAKYPVKHLCSICGFQGIYVCMKCGLRYCSLKCDSTHKETRCLKMYGH